MVAEISETRMILLNVVRLKFLGLVVSEISETTGNRLEKLF